VAREAPTRVRVTGNHARAWLIAVVVAVAIFTFLFWAMEGWSFSDALFMTVTTLTTVGYGQIQPLDESGRIVAMAAAITGAVLIFG